MSTPAASEAPITMCVANIGKAGRVRRSRVGSVLVLLALGIAGWFIATHAPWFVRLSVFLPATAAAISLLQVSRNTCVAMAAKSVRENEDFTYTPVEKVLADASRKVASSIYRDGLLIGVGAALITALTTLLY